jgi:hypothetical protein
MPAAVYDIGGHNGDQTSPVGSTYGGVTILLEIWSRIAAQGPILIMLTILTDFTGTTGGD